MMEAKKENPVGAGIQSYPKVEINFSPEVPTLKKTDDKTKINGLPM